MTAAASSVFGGLEGAYLDMLRWVLNHRLFTAFGAAAMLGSLLLLPLIGSEYLPPSDEGEVRVSGKMEIGTRLDIVDRQTHIMEDIIRPAVPEALSSVVSVGASGWRVSAGSEGSILMSLLPASQRERSNVEIAQAPLARAVIGGLIGSTLITLVLIPMVYSLFHPGPKVK